MSGGSQIAAAEDWLVEEMRRLFPSAFRSIESGPGEWSEDYLKRVVAAAPALRVAFLDGAPSSQTTALTLDTRWSIYVLAGWSGGGQEQRRRGTARSVGSYRAAGLIAPWLHNCVIPDVGSVRVADVQNLWSGSIDRAGLSLLSIGLSIPIPFDPEIDESGFDDFLTAGDDWDLPGTGGPVDLAGTFAIPQGDPAP